MSEFLRRPLPWALVAGAALLAALALSPRSPGWLFWGMTGLSCTGTALALWFRSDASD